MTAPPAIKGDVTVLVQATDVMYTALSKNGYDYSKLTPADMDGLAAPEVIAAEKHVTAYVTTTCGINPTNLGAGAASSAQPSDQSPSAGAAATSAAAAGTACGLFTTAEVSTAAGKQMAVSSDGGTICAYSAVGDPPSLVYVTTYPDEASMQLMHQLGSEDKTGALTGLGDQAFWNTTAATVFVQQGSKGFSVASPTVVAESDPQLKARMLTLAQHGLPRL